MSAAGSAGTLARQYVEANAARLKPALVVRCPKQRHVVARVFSTRWGLFVWPEPITMPPAAHREAAEHGRTLPASYSEPGGLIVELPRGTTAGWRGGCRCAVYRPLQDDVLAAIEARRRELVLDETAEWHPGFGETQESTWEIIERAARAPQVGTNSHD